jgi:hypothetical protein
MPGTGIEPVHSQGARDFKYLPPSKSYFSKALIILENLVSLGLSGHIQSQIQSDANRCISKPIVTIWLQFSITKERVCNGASTQLFYPLESFVGRTLLSALDFLLDTIFHAVNGRDSEVQTFKKPKLTTVFGVEPSFP